MTSPHIGPAIFLLPDDKAKDYERKQFYRELKQIRWIAPKIRDAIEEEISALAVEENGLPYDKLVAVSKSNWRRRIAKTDPHIASESERRAFFGLIYRIAWLPPTFRHAIAKQLGLSAEAYKADLKRWWATSTRLRIAAHMERGSSYDDAKSLIAEEDGLTVAALKKRLEKKRAT